MDRNDTCVGRILTPGDLRLTALSFIAEAPRHGYGIIKLVEEKTAYWYSPSSGMVYPALTYLQEAGYVTASAEGSKKIYAITPEGRDYLKTNGELVESALDRLTALAQHMSRWRSRGRAKTINRRTLPPLVEATFDHLRETIRRRLKYDAGAEVHLVEIIADADAELQRK